MQKLLIIGGAALLAGCCCIGAKVEGNYGIQLPYENMPACSVILSRDDAGAPKAVTLVRWSSPEVCEAVEFDGPEFTFRQPVQGWLFKGTVAPGGRVVGTMQRYDRKLFAEQGEFKLTGKEIWWAGWRNEPMIEGVKSEDAVYGEPIDLFAEGLEGWKIKEQGAKNCWSFENGVLANTIKHDDSKKRVRNGNLVTKRSDFTDFKLSFDTCVPADSNSGVYLRGRYEIQIIDSYGKDPDRHNMAALYGRIAPSVAAEKPAGEWQHVDVQLYKRHITVVLNGVKIIDNQPIEGVTGGAIDANENVAGPIYLQGDHSDAMYKNMILTPIVR